MRKRVGFAFVVFICSVVVLAVALHAQSVAVVRGRVLDARGAPVVRIKVTIGSLWAYSDTTGRYLFSRVPFGTYSLSLERDRRKVVKLQIDVHQATTDVPDLRWP